MHCLPLIRFASIEIATQILFSICYFSAHASISVIYIRENRSKHILQMKRNGYNFIAIRGMGCYESITCINALGNYNQQFSITNHLSPEYNNITIIRYHNKK